MAMQGKTEKMENLRCGYTTITYTAADVMLSGRLFHSFGPAEANDCSPLVTRREGLDGQRIG